VLEQALGHEDVWWSGDVVPRILNHRLEKGVWPTSRPRERASGTHFIGSCVRVRISLKTARKRHFFLIFFIWIVGGGVQLGPLGIAASKRHIVPTPGDYDDGKIGGMMIDKGNGSTKKICPSATLSTTNPTCSARKRTRAAAVGSRRLTAWAMARPNFVPCWELYPIPRSSSL
jgi:hypothetical protein